MRILCSLLWICLGATAAYGAAPAPVVYLAQGVPALVWDAVTKMPDGTALPLPIGYAVEQGKTCGTWTKETIVGNIVQWPLAEPTTQYCYAVRAYLVNIDGTKQFSTDSNAVVFTPDPVQPAPDPRCALLGDRHISAFVTSLHPTNGTVAGSKVFIDFQLASPNSPISKIEILLSGNTVKASADATTNGDAGLVDVAGLWFTLPTTAGNYPVILRLTNAYGCVTTQALNAIGQPMTLVVK